MKSPLQLSERLSKQWHNGSLREKRLLEDAFPFRLPIGKPTASEISTATHAVKEHLSNWRNVREGEVLYEKKTYRSTGEISIPTHWQINNLTEWLRAAQNKEVEYEGLKLIQLLEAADDIFHPVLVRKAFYWRAIDTEEAQKVLEVVDLLEPGCANGVPLRSLSLAGVDTKFFERNSSMITELLDVKYDGIVKELGLEGFLNAWKESDHWLLLVDLDGTMLPFSQQRVRTAELQHEFCKAERCLIIENEKCLHMLPPMQNTIAILGAGLDLNWTKAEWLKSMKVGYWGDIDTWGLQMLSIVRKHIPHVSNILMNEETFHHHEASSAVVEKCTADSIAKDFLTEPEQALYDLLKSKSKGRLEQEFLQPDFVKYSVTQWYKER